MLIKIDRMREEDLADVLAIEMASFSLPWTEEMFRNELSRGDVSSVLVSRVAEEGGQAQVVGYLCLWVVGDELHINNVAVDPRWRRRGLARRLITAALDHGRARGAAKAYLEVRASNTAAQNLYRDFGFVPVGIRQRYYTHPVEDAVVMARQEL